MAKRDNRQNSGRSRTPDIPNMREQRHQIAAKYYLACRQSHSNQNNDALGRSATYINAINFKVNKAQLGSLRTVYGSVAKFLVTEEFDNSEGEDFTPVTGTVVNDMFFVVWLDNNGISDKNYITINDKIVLETSNLGFSRHHHIDISESNNSLGGEVFLTDYNIPPVYFMVKDMLDNYGITDKYTTAFDISQHTLNTDLPINQMIFKRLYQTGALNGLATGSYAYSYRLVSNSGDKSNWSPSTPLIQVPDNIMYYPLSETVVDGTKEGSREYNERLATGQLPADINISQCGCELWLRIDNRLGYNEVEVSRTEYNVGAGLETTGQTVLIQRILIQPGDFFILVIKDDKSTQTSDTLISIDEESSINSIIKRAKTIRYFNNKVQLGNVEYEDSKNLSLDDITLQEDGDGDKITPLTHYNYRRQVYGMLDEQFRTYNKSLMDEEAYDFAIVAWGDSMSRVNIIEPDELKSVKLPSRDRRKTEKQRALSQNLSYEESATNMENINGSIGNKTKLDEAEFGDNFDEVVYVRSEHSQPQEFINDEVLKFATPGWFLSNASDIKVNISNRDNEDFIYSRSATRIGNTGYKPSDVGFKIKSPVNKSDSKAFNEKSLWRISYDAENIFTNSSPYNEPFDKNPAVRSLCLGITNLNVGTGFIKAVSVVRTRPAKRVIIQGLCTYDMKDGDFDGALDIKSYTKGSDSFTFLSPDSWLLSDDELYTLKNSPDRFRVKISRPQKFTTEVMAVSSPFVVPMIGGGDIPAELNRPESMGISDILCHPYYGNMLPDGTEDSFPTTGKHFPPGGKAAAALLANGDDEDGFEGFEMDGFTEVFEQEGVVKYRVKLKGEIPDSLYIIESVGNNKDLSYSLLEPLYIASIIDTGASTSNLDVKDYYESSQMIKLESVVEIISEDRDYKDYRIYTVDERDEDFHVSPLCGVEYKDTLSYDRKIYVKRDGTYLTLWNINGFRKGNDTDDKNDLLYDKENGTTDFRGFAIHGVYESKRDENGDLYIILKPARIKNDSLEPPIDIQLYSDYYFKFRPGDEIIVRFDNTKPVKCFGESYVGSHCALQFHRESEVIEGDARSPFVMGADFPFRSFILNPAIAMNFQNHSMVTCNGTFWYIRQMMWRFFCKSRTATPLTDGSVFPNTQYIPRVMPMSRGDVVQPPFDPETYAYLYPEYEEKFPGERLRWQYGGFNPKQLNHNIDYSKRNENYKYVSIKERNPSLLTENRNLYPTRVVWSLTRPISSYYSSGLRTFRPFSYKDLDDKNSQIIKLFNHISNSGANLMAFTEKALYLLLTNKRVLTGASDEVVTTSIDETDYIPQVVQVPTKSNSGLPLGFEGTFAEGGNSVCWANDSGVYLLKNGAVYPLHKNAEKFVMDFIASVKSSGQKFTSYLNVNTDEYYLSIEKRIQDPPVEEGEDPPVEEGEEPPAEESQLLVLGLLFSISDDKMEYVSILTYNYDLFLVLNNIEHGVVKSLNKCYIESLDEAGEVAPFGIDLGASVQDSISQVDSSFFDKEFIDIQVNSNEPPISVGTDFASIEAFAYRGSWWSRVPRDSGRRAQGTSFNYNIEFSIQPDEDDREYTQIVLNGFILHYKNLK